MFQLQLLLSAVKMLNFKSFLQFCYIVLHFYCIFISTNHKNQHTSVPARPDGSLIPTSELTLRTCLSTGVKSGAAIYD